VFGPALALAGFVSGLAYDALAPGGIEAQTRIYWIMVALSAGGLVLAIWGARRRQPAAAETG